MCDLLPGHHRASAAWYFNFNLTVDPNNLAPPTSAPRAWSSVKHSKGAEVGGVEIS